MSIQVTEKITRKDAEDRLISKLLKRQEMEIKGRVMFMNNKMIEDEIEDAFTNYSIKE